MFLSHCQRPRSEEITAGCTSIIFSRKIAATDCIQRVKFSRECAARKQYPAFSPFWKKLFLQSVVWLLHFLWTKESKELGNKAHSVAEAEAFTLCKSRYWLTMRQALLWSGIDIFLPNDYFHHWKFAFSNGGMVFKNIKLLSLLQWNGYFIFILFALLFYSSLSLRSF